MLWWLVCVTGCGFEKNMPYMSVKPTMNTRKRKNAFDWRMRLAMGIA